MISNSDTWKGGASLFLAILTLTELPMVFSPILMRFGAADIEPQRREKLERAAAGGSF